MIQSVTFHLVDSLPREVIEKWRIELGLSGSAGFQPAKSSRPKKPAGKDAGAPEKTPDQLRRETEFRKRIQDYLDAGHGACWLRKPEIAELVENALRHFDVERYRLLAWCIMPNHVHVLIEMKEGFPLNEVMHSWKSFTGSAANKLLGLRGEFWQREYHDRFVRNAEHYAAVLAYIEENPAKAGLARIKTDWPWSSVRFRSGSAGIPVGEQE